MNGIEKITARIETDVKAEIAAILKEGEERAAKIRVDYEAKAKAEAAAAQEAGRQAAARQLERLESAAKMDAKKELLAAKQECLDEAFAQAQKKLSALPEAEYVELLAKLVVKAAKTGKEELIFSAADKKRVGAKVVKKANELLAGIGQEASLTLCEESRDMDGGVTLRNGNVEVNCAFETQLRILRGSMAAEIAAILFA
ncbi:MAG: V-type ATP synthase subunit E [Oscillospiraceae bacterium]|nr:V-type ATP synthase subunit E [Oscillospiraceae bacterium]